MAASITDLLTQATNTTRPTPTTLTAIKNISATSLTTGSLTGWPTGTAVHFVLYTIDTTGAKVSGSQSDWKGIVSGTTITNLTLKAGTDQAYGIGTIVEATPTAAWANDVVSWGTAQHNQDGSHATVTATNLTVATGLTLPNNSITAANLATSAITLGYTPITSDFTITGTVADTQVTSMTVTVTIPAGGRKVKVTAYTGRLEITGSGVTATMKIWDGTVGSGTQVAQAELQSANGTAVTIQAGQAQAVAILTPSAGSKTYNVSLAPNNSGQTAAIRSAATRPSFILVELI